MFVFCFHSPSLKINCFEYYLKYQLRLRPSLVLYGLDATQRAGGVSYHKEWCVLSDGLISVSCDALQFRFTLNEVTS